MPKISTAARNSVAFAFVELTGIRIYSGPIPTDRNAAPTGTLLASFDQVVGLYSAQKILWGPTPSSGTYSVDTTSTSVIPAVAGTAGYAMIYAPADSIVHWIYCTVGLAGSGAELILSSLDFTEGCAFTIKSGSATVLP